MSPSGLADRTAFFVHIFPSIQLLHALTRRCAVTMAWMPSWQHNGDWFNACAAKQGKEIDTLHVSACTDCINVWSDYQPHR
jgi:hypothetical protein